MYKTRITPREWDPKSPLGFWDRNGSHNIAQMTRPTKKRTCWIVDFAVPLDNIVKVTKSEMIDNYLDLVRKLKKTVEHELTITPIVIGIVGIVSKIVVEGLKELEIRGRVEINQTNVLLRSAWILRRVLETWQDLLSLGIQWETIGHSEVKTQRGILLLIIIK